MAVKSVPGSRNHAPAIIVIRRDEGDEQLRHGGVWKIAYADFVTALMAFFMLMWLLNATTEVQRDGLADYFAPTNLFGRSMTGSGKPFGGATPNDPDTGVATAGLPRVVTGPQPARLETDEEDVETPVRSLVQDDTGSEDVGTHPQPQSDEGNAMLAEKPGKGRQAFAQGGDYAAPQITPSSDQQTSASAPAQMTPSPGQQTPASTAAADATPPQTAPQSEQLQEQHTLDQVGVQLLEAIRRDPALREFEQQIIVENIPEGLRIQVVDAERRPMFALGSSSPSSRVRDLMQKVAPALAGLPNAISISGHTDSLTYRGQEMDNWELSSERANASRRILVEAGLAESRIRAITGNADRDLLVPSDPLNPANRRIAIIVLRHAGTGEPKPVPHDDKPLTGQ